MSNTKWKPRDKDSIERIIDNTHYVIYNSPSGIVRFTQKVFDGQVQVKFYMSGNYSSFDSAKRAVLKHANKLTLNRVASAGKDHMENTVKLFNYKCLDCYRYFQINVLPSRCCYCCVCGSNDIAHY